MIHKHAIPCSCVSTCGVALIMEIEGMDSEPSAYYGEFFMSYQGGLRGRLRTAWRVVRGKSPWLHSIAIDPTEIAALHAWLGKTAALEPK